MAALLPARRAAAAAAAAAASASSASAAASASASASAARLSSSSSSRSLSSVSTAAAAAAAATRAMRAPPVGNMPEPFAWKEEPAPPTPAGWKATTSAPKKTTRLAGLHPEPHAREKLHALYEQTLRAVRRLEGGGGSDGGERRDPQSGPNPYRAAVEQLTRHRMALVAAEPDIPALEEKIGAGQIEELLQQARDELELIPVMASWRPWERPSAEAGAGGASGGPYPAHEPAVLVEDRAKAFLKDMVDTSPREQK